MKELNKSKKKILICLSEPAKKLATNEKLEYIDNVRNELKKRDQAHYDKVEEQMMEIPGYEKYKKIS